MSFTGIPFAALDFYEDLEVDNTRSFWTAHKQVYEEQVRAPLEALAHELEPEFGQAKFFRPYRDVRFAKDKTPYKTQQGVWFAATSRYLQIDAAGLMVAGGYWSTSPDQVERLRRAIDTDVAGAGLEQAVAAVCAAGLTIDGHRLTRVPRGYDKGHPRADLLCYRTMTAGRGFGSPAWLRTRRARTEIVKAWRAMAPLVDWLDQHVGRG